MFIEEDVQLVPRDVLVSQEVTKRIDVTHVPVGSQRDSFDQLECNQWCCNSTKISEKELPGADVTIQQLKDEERGDEGRGRDGKGQLR